MSNYEEEHNIVNNVSNSSSNHTTHRPHQTLTQALEEFHRQTSNISSPISQLEQAIQLIEESGIRETLLEQLDSSTSDINQGMPQEYIDSLERVDKKSLKKDMACSICTSDFLDDPHPLVVRLPCDGKHKFDLECISPWLAVKGSCPLCRKNLVKNEKNLEVEDSEDEEDGWEMYG